MVQSLGFGTLPAVALGSIPGLGTKIPKVTGLGPKKCVRTQYTHTHTHTHTHTLVQIKLGNTELGPHGLYQRQCLGCDNAVWFCEMFP